MLCCNVRVQMGVWPVLGHIERVVQCHNAVISRMRSGCRPQFNGNADDPKRAGNMAGVLQGLRRPKVHICCHASQLEL